MRFLAIVVALIVFGSTVSQVAAAATEPYDIDVILPITGAGSFVGTTQQKSLIVLQGVVNKDGGIRGRPVRFVFHDDQTSPQVSLQLATQIIARNPAVVIGSALSALCKAAQPLYGSGPLNYCLSPVISPERGGFVFAASVSGTDYVLASLRYFRGRGWKRFASLTTTDASGQIADNDIANLLKLPENKEMTLVAAEHFNPTDTTATAQISKIKSASPQAIIVWTPGTPFGTALRAISDVGLNIPVLTTSANMIESQLRSYVGILPRDTYFQGLAYVAGYTRTKESQALRAFTAALKSNGIPQDFQSGLAWDPAMIVIDGLRKIGPSATALQLRDYVANLNHYVGIAGVYNFRASSQRGLTVDDTLIMRWDPDAGAFISVSKFGGTP